MIQSKGLPAIKENFWHGTPVLDEEDLEENEIDEDDVDDIEWEDTKA